MRFMPLADNQNSDIIMIAQDAEITQEEFDHGMQMILQDPNALVMITAIQKIQPLTFEQLRTLVPHPESFCESI